MHPSEPHAAYDRRMIWISVFAVALWLSGRELATVADERERDMRVADQADAILLHVQAQLGQQR